MKRSFKILTLSVAGGCLLAASAAQNFYSVMTLQAAAASTQVTTPAAGQQQTVKVTGKSFKEQTAEYQADLLIPVLKGMKDTKYEEQLNGIIARHAMEDLENLKKAAGEAAIEAKKAGYELRPHTIDVQYELKANGGEADAGLISLKITTYANTGGASGVLRIDTYNVLDKEEARRVDLKQLFGDNYKETVNASIRQQIAKQPDSYFVGEKGFKGISDTQSFYVEKGNAVIVFQKYEIAPGAAGSPEFRIPLSARTEAVQNQSLLSTKSVTEEADNVITNLNIPVFEGLRDKKYQAQLNDMIESKVMKELDNLKKQAREDEADAKKSGFKIRPYTLDIHFEVKSDGGAANDNIVSIELITYTYTGGAHGMPRIETYNILDEAQATRVELKDLLGGNYKETVNEFIRQQIAKQPDDYFKLSFKGISDTQSFYIEKGAAVILFDVYEIAPYAAGIPEFRLALPKHSTNAVPPLLIVGGTELTVGEASVYTTHNGTTMAPLRIIAERLGYNVKWVEKDQSVELSKGARWTSLRAGEDSYIVNKMAPFPLGQAPEINKDNNMYVPLSFFSDVLNAEVTTESGAIRIQ